MRKKLGISSLLLISLTTINLWLMSKDGSQSLFANPNQSLSQLFSLLGIVLLGASLLLSTKISFFEWVFGGQDEVIKIHRIVGSIAFVFIVNHPLLLAVQYLPKFKTALLYLTPNVDLAYNLGIFALYVMIVSFVFMAFIRLPYHIWKRSHQLLGISFILGSAHALLISSDISRYLPLKLWIGEWIGIGILSFIYTALLYKHVGPKYAYEIVGVERILDIVNIIMKPLGKKLPFLPGQYAYISLTKSTVHNEIHPFSLSSSPHESTLRISAKIVGDWTLTLPSIKIGDRVNLLGPYGKFGQLNLKPNNQLVLIGGGIGITPFLSVIRHAAVTQTQQPMACFYCYGNPEDGVFASELNTLKEQLGHNRIFSWCSKLQGRITVAKIKELLGSLENVSIVLCGPPPMMENLKLQFVENGVPEKRILYEQFDFLS